MVPKDSAWGSHFSGSSSLPPSPPSEGWPGRRRGGGGPWRAWKDSALHMGAGSGGGGGSWLGRDSLVLLTWPSWQHLEWGTGKPLKQWLLGNKSIFDKRPDNWTLAAHQIRVGSSDQKASQEARGSSLGRELLLCARYCDPTCQGGETAPRARTLIISAPLPWEFFIFWYAVFNHVWFIPVCPD